MSLVSSINSRGIFSFQKRVEKSEKSVEILTPTFHPSRLFRYDEIFFFFLLFSTVIFSPFLPFFLFFSFRKQKVSITPSNDQCIAVNAAASSVVNVSRRARFFKSMIPSPPPPRAYTMGGQDFFQCQGKTYPRHVSAKGSDIPPPPCFWLDLRVACSQYYSIRHFSPRLDPHVTLRRVKFCRSENLFAACQ